MDHPIKEIRVRRQTKCLTCRTPIPRLSLAWWVLGVGCWHRGCPVPPQLPEYIAARNTGHNQQSDPDEVRSA